jgi:putative membrane protein
MAVSRSDALQLQQALALRAGQPLDAPEGAESQVLRRLSVGDLILAGSTAGRLGIALPLVFSAMTFADDIIPYDRIFGSFDRLPGVSILLAIALALLLFAWVLGLAGTILAHAGFRLSRIGDNLLIERGLLERRRATIPIGRIQAVRIVEGPTRQLLGLVELRVESAAHGRSAGESTVLFPLLRRGDVLPLLQGAVPDLATEPPLTRLPSRARRRYVSRLLLPALLVSVPVAILLFPLGLLALALVPLAILLGFLQYADAGWAFDPSRLIVRGRMLDRTTAIVPRRRIQFMNLASNPFQRRAQLATLGVHVASGFSGRGFHLLHLDAGHAGRLLGWFQSSRAGAERSNEAQSRMSLKINEHLRPLAGGPQDVRIRRPDER